MKRVLLGMTVAFSLLASTGCNLLDRRQCNSCNGNVGCRPCNLGWQRGGSDYQRFLGHNGAHNGAPAGGQGMAGIIPREALAISWSTTHRPSASKQPLSAASG